MARVRRKYWSILQCLMIRKRKDELRTESVNVIIVQLKPRLRSKMEQTILSVLINMKTL